MAKAVPLSERKAYLALLRAARLDAGLRQVDVAKRLGQPQPFVSKYESGERRLDVLEFRKVCRAIGIAPQEFFDRLEKALR